MASTASLMVPKAVMTITGAFRVPVTARTISNPSSPAVYVRHGNVEQRIAQGRQRFFPPQRKQRHTLQPAASSTVTRISLSSSMSSTASFI